MHACQNRTLCNRGACAEYEYPDISVICRAVGIGSLRKRCRCLSDCCWTWPCLLACVAEPDAATLIVCVVCMLHGRHGPHHLHRLGSQLAAQQGGLTRKPANTIISAIIHMYAVNIWHLHALFLFLENKFASQADGSWMPTLAKPCPQCSSCMLLVVVVDPMFRRSF